MKIFGKDVNIDGKVVLTIAGVALSLLGTVVNAKSSEYEKKALKAELKEDIVKDLMSNQG